MVRLLTFYFCFWMILSVQSAESSIWSNEEQQDPPLLSLYSNHPSLARLDLISHYILPNDHPAKSKLDMLFTSSRVLLNMKTLKNAGFVAKDPRKYTRIITATHPDFPEYFFKLFLDAQRYDEKLPLDEFWMLRIQGALLIQNEINKNGWQHLFKVPRKWIYVLPPLPLAPSGFASKDFILIEDKMDIQPKSKNEQLWKSNDLPIDFLYSFFCLIRNTGFRDVKPDNVPFCEDGRVAFVDTQLFLLPVDYNKMTPFLSSHNRFYWKQWIKTTHSDY